MAFADQQTIKGVVTDFLSSAPTLEEIVSYKLPDKLQDRAHELLEKNREGSLSSEDSAEIEEFRQIDHLLALIKIKAELKLKNQS